MVISRPTLFPNLFNALSLTLLINFSLSPFLPLPITPHSIFYPFSFDIKGNQFCVSGIIE